MREDKKNISQPEKESEQLLSDIINDSPSYVEVRGKKWALKWLKNATKRKVTTILLDDKEQEEKVSTKICAALRCNGYWSLKLFYPILWRWMYYIKQYTDDELLEYVALGKKKVGAESYLMITILSTGMKDTIMAMTRKEVEHIQAEQLMAQHGLSQKSTQTSVPPSTYSEA